MRQVVEQAWVPRTARTRAYGFKAFEDPTVASEFRRFLDGRTWTFAEGPGALFEQGVGWLRRNRVLGVPVAMERIWSAVFVSM